jgi:hypothetical protein
VADYIRVEVKGVKELQNAFKLTDSDIRNILPKAVSQGAGVVERDAKMRVHVLTGNLRRSLAEFQQIKSLTRVESQVGSTVPYAAAEEFRPGHEYLRPALDENQEEIKAAIYQAIYDRLQRYRK